MKSLKTTIVSLGLALTMTGCLVPEKFTARVEFDEKAGYSFNYKGSAFNPMVAEQIRKNGSLSASELEALKKDAERLSKRPGVIKYAYSGNARYEIHLNEQKNPGQALSAFDVFKITTQKDGSVRVFTPSISKQNLEKLKQLGTTVDGTLEVVVPKNAVVIEHNATSTPTLGFGAYSWKIGKVDQQPMMTLRFQ